MATVTTNPGTRIAAFGNPILIASTTSTTDATLRLTISSGLNLLAEQYALIVDGSSTFQMAGTVQSLLAGFNNPISYTMEAGDVQVVPTAKHYIDDLVIYVFEPVDLIGTATLSGINIFKSMNLDLATWTSGEDSRFAMHGANPRRYGFQGMKIPFTFFSSYALSSPMVSINETFSDPPIIITANEEYFVTTWKDSYAAKIKVFNVGTKTSHNELTLITEDWPCRGKILYFLNDLGGWEWHPFIDYDVNERTDKEQLTTRTATGQRNILQKITDTTKEYKLYSGPFASENIDYLRFLLTSPVVLDENGLQVRVMDNNLRTNSSELIEPDITIQYVEEDTINV